MKPVNSWLTIAGWFIIVSCAVKTNQIKQSSQEKKITTIKPAEVLEIKNGGTARIYFRASGTMPFWALTIDDDYIKFRMPEDSIVVPNVSPDIAADANLKRYRSHSDRGELTVQIAYATCNNNASGFESPYEVSVSYKGISDNTGRTVTGCGQYVTDYRLHDIWVLEMINGVKASKTKFPLSLPLMEINSTTNKFSGFAGCNEMNGALFFEQGLLRFTNIVTTKKLCESSDGENEFLKTLQSTTTYSIGNNRLTLSNANGSDLVFKKID